VTARTSYDDYRKQLKRRTARAEQLAAPLWARILRQVAIWGGAAMLAVGTYIGASFAVSAFLDDQEDETPFADAAAALGDDLVYVDRRAEGVLDQAALAALKVRAARTSQPTRVVVWPHDGGWRDDVVEYIAARSNLESRFLLVDPEGQTAVASTLAESEPSVPYTTDALPVAEAATQALDDLDRVPLRGEREEYDEGGQFVGEVWLAAAAGGGLALAVGFVAVSGAFVAFGVVLLVVLTGALAVMSYRRRKVGPAIADIEARPAERRGRNRVVYRPPNDVLVRLNKVRVTERAELLRDELLALGERMAASTDHVAGEAWALALDCYAVAGRIADSVEGRDDLASHADVVGGLVLVARGRRAVDAAEAGREVTESTDCFANPFHGTSVGAVPTIALGMERPPASVPQQVEVCATCRSAAKKGIAVADPLVLDSGRGRMQAYWMDEVKPWAEIGYGAGSRELINAWNRPRV
jgi:hypothetical protein